MKRKQHSSEFKARVALEAIRGEKTINEIASVYAVHPNVVGLWKKQALDHLPDLFSDKRSKNSKDDTVLQDRLYQQIGQLQVELDWLKKKTGISD
jgi:putative transposase